MANLLEYVLLADDAYESSTDCTPPHGWYVVPGLSRDDAPFWRPGSSIWSSGLQGRAYRHQHRREAVIAFKGTNPIMASDIAADTGIVVAKLGGGLIAPTQMVEALRLTETWVSRLAHSCGGRISLVGHSLGGGIAQYVGASLELPFVTFNAPGVLTITPAAAAAPLKAISKTRGINYIFWGDTIGNFGAHIGETRRLKPLSVFNPIPLKKHFLSNFKRLLLANSPDFSPDDKPLG